jgi:hypothetical protein
MTYAWEKFHLAMHSLAGPGSIQERLADAYSLHLSHIDPDELPEEIQGIFKQMRHDLASGRGGVEAAVGRLSEEETLKYVEIILSMHDTVARQGGTF